MKKFKRGDVVRSQYGMIYITVLVTGKQYKSKPRSKIVGKWFPGVVLDTNHSDHEYAEYNKAWNKEVFKKR